MGKMTYPYQILEEKVNNLNLKLIGVEHTLEFFNEHKYSFQEEIGSAKAVLVEDVVMINGANPDGSAGLTYSDFYSRIAELAREKRIPVYIPDVSNRKTIFSFAGEVAIGYGMELAGVFGMVKRTSRRSFLKNLALFLAGSDVAMSGPLNGLFGEVARDENIILDDALQYNTVIDYRNLISAENIDRMSRTLKLDGKAVYFIGDGHINGIHAYLKEPWLRHKKLLYMPQDLAVGDTSARKYEFNEEEERWELTEKI